MRTLVRSLALFGMLSACEAVPDSNPDYDARPAATDRGAVYGDYQAYEAARLDRERELRGIARPAAPSGTAPEPVISADELRAAGLPSAAGAPVLPAAEPVDSAPLGAPVAAAPAGPLGGTSGTFDAAGSGAGGADAAPLAGQRPGDLQPDPGAVPPSGARRPNIVQYALSTTNALGQPVYSRSGALQRDGSQGACRAYTAPDLAQEVFLAAGGPETDTLGLDPDGDGFACDWDPAPYRAAQG
ncbi:hypothetical protein [Palleronia rufa]|uniref:hypothetical protein n=1 Tax=Palleronia rufa TaxID=1530186 RepID=UPI00068BEB43|nr:hypothetical protein [Palleronia rufa]